MSGLPEGPVDGHPQGAEAPPPGVRTMSVVRWVLVVLTGLVAVGSLATLVGRGGDDHAGSQSRATIYTCPMHPQIVQDHPGDCPICNMRLVPRATAGAGPAPARPVVTAIPDGGTGRYWCPMHPQVTSDDPKARCPLCGGMQLVPRPVAVGGAAAAANTSTAAPVPGLVPVEIPIDRVQTMGLRTAPVTRGSLQGSLRAAGSVVASERGLAQISPRFSGWIEALLVSETGQRVKRGQVLATIYSPDVLQAQQELLTALGWNSGAGGSLPGGAAGGPPHHQGAAPLDAMVADARRRLELLGISPQEIEAVVQKRQPQRAIAIRSPVNGHVITKTAVLGMNVAAGTPLFEVADLSTVWVIAEIYEADVPRVRLGQVARFQAAAVPGEEFTGKVQLVHPTLDASSRTLRLRVELRNRPGPDGLRLRPGMYGSVMLDLPAGDGLTMPAEALVDTGEQRYVFVALAEGRFQPRRVKVGAHLGDRLVVTEGLKEGERVVTTAAFLIDSESRLRAAIEGQR